MFYRFSCPVISARILIPTTCEDGATETWAWPFRASYKRRIITLPPATFEAWKGGLFPQTSAPIDGAYLYINHFFYRTQTVTRGGFHAMHSSACRRGFHTYVALTTFTKATLAKCTHSSGYPYFAVWRAHKFFLEEEMQIENANRKAAPADPLHCRRRASKGKPSRRQDTLPLWNPGLSRSSRRHTGWNEW